MYRYFNENPCGKLSNDCVIRAISCLLGKSWEETYLDICSEGLRMCDMPSVNSVWASYLYGKGFVKLSVPLGYTIKRYVLDYPDGDYLLSTGDHVVCVKNGTYYDAWDSGDEIVEAVFRRK